MVHQMMRAHFPNSSRGIYLLHVSLKLQEIVDVQTPTQPFLAAAKAVLHYKPFGHPSYIELH